MSTAPSRVPLRPSGVRPGGRTRAGRRRGGASKPPPPGEGARVDGGAANGGTSAPVANNGHRSSIDFGDVFAELLSYRRDNGGSLSIPASHPAVARIIDGLSSSSEGIETLSKKRWEDQMAALRKFKEDHGDLDVPVTHPTLGRWVQIQRENYELYERRMPSALTKKRHGRLKAMGFGGGGEGGQSRGTDEDAKLERKERAGREEEEEAASNGSNAAANLAEEGGGSPAESKPRPSNDVKNAATAIKPKKEEEAPTESVETTRPRPKEENSEEGNGERTQPPAKAGRQATKLKGKCDVCEKKDGFWGHNLQQCKECKLLVHELCCGVPETDCKDPDFVCHACKAVGRDVEVNVPSRIGGCGEKTGEKRELVRQKERPTECVLCTHNTGIHAIQTSDIASNSNRRISIGIILIAFEYVKTH